MKKVNVVEKFISINGEGQKAGRLAAFIRMKGCNLQCSYCDTAWANEKNCASQSMEVSEVVDFVEKSNVKYVTLTGGEPLLQENIEELIDDLLKLDDLEIEIETNGSIDLSDLKGKNEKRLSFTMDYKLPSSDMESFMLKSNFSLLDKSDTLKFVVGNNNDLSVVKKLTDEYRLEERTSVYLSPVYGEIDLQEIVEWMKNNQMNNTALQMQLHKVIWGSTAQGV